MQLSGSKESACFLSRTALPPTQITPRGLHTQAAALLESAADFQAAYLAAALARLSEAAAAAFPGTSRALPTAADLQKAIARVHEELKACSGGWVGAGWGWAVACAAGAPVLSRCMQACKAPLPSVCLPL